MRVLTCENVHRIGDLQHLVSLNPSQTEIHIHIASLFFYSLGEPDRARAQLKQCLSFDQDNKICKKHLRRIRSLAKAIDKAKDFQEKRKYSSAVKILAGSGDDKGLISDAREDFSVLKKEKYLNDRVSEGLLVNLLTMACESYVEMSSHKRAAPYCDEVLVHDPQSLPAVLNKSKRLIDEELYEEAIRILEQGRESHPHDQRLHSQTQEAQMLLRRSKQKDYYKVLGVNRDATQADIKKAYRKLAKQWHPDGYRGDMTKEQVEKKYSTITEAYEVLRSDELRARFDRGDDPNEPQGQNPFAQGGHPFGGFGGQQFFFRQDDGGHEFPFGHGGGFKFNF